MMVAQNITALRGTLLQNELLARHTSWRVGGPAKSFYAPADLADLAEFLQQLPADEPLLWLGLGSNLLVRDGGFKGTVLALSGALNQMQVVDSNTVRAEAGVACAKVARFCAQHDLIGAEFFAGIPGTLGGALAMNAGAFGGETWRIVQQVETIDRCGVIRHRPPADFDVSYRHVRAAQGEWFVAGYLQLPKGDGTASRARIKELLDKRNQSQPTQWPSCGSVFRNPPNDFAGRLVEASGLKGFCIGGACVSEKHANFIVNTGNATAAQIEQLIAHVKTTVAQKFHVSLTPEVHVVGEPGELTSESIS